jgi:protein-tyrosine-phosphatase
VIIHFICRGNAFRSIIAEAYLNSLEIKDWIVLSSGTAAASEKARNVASYGKTLELLEKHGIRRFAKAGYGDQLTQSRLERADITVCMNQRVYGECLRYVTFPASPRVWSVADLGEPGRISDVESERRLYREEAYRQIVRNVDRLISDLHTSLIALAADRARWDAPVRGLRMAASTSCLVAEVRSAAGRSRPRR